VEVELGLDEADKSTRPIACLLFPEDGEDELQTPYSASSCASWSRTPTKRR